MRENSVSITKLNDELKAMGLSLTDHEELALAQAVGEAWDASRRGERVSLESLLIDWPSLIPQAKVVLDHLKQLDESALTLSTLASTVIPSDSGSNPSSATPQPKEPVPDPFPGEYVFKRRVGTGTFGDVWLADDLNLGVPVAIKTIKMDNAKASRETMVRLLQKDAQMLAPVHHNHVVQVRCLRTCPEGQPHVVMEYIPGGSLLDRLNQRGEPFEWPDACQWMADTGDAVLEVHRLGMLHRDIKPANILYDDDCQQARLADFGLAARRAELCGEGGCTPAYSPPEAWDNHFSEASDLYGLGATLFHLLTKRLLSLPNDHRKGLPNPDPRLNHVPQWLEDLLRQTLSPRPEDRPTLKQFSNTLRGRLNQSFLDNLQTNQPGDTVDLRIQAFLEVGPCYVPISPTIQRMTQRTVKHNPPPSFKLKTSDRFRVQIKANRPGHLVVFNVGSDGEFNLLYPDATTKIQSRPDIEAGKPWNLDDPPGTECIAAIWGSRPIRDLWSEQQLKQFFDPGPTPYEGTRNLRHIQEALQSADSEFRLTILELDHVAL